ncbi:hypothetical protein RFI_37369, partial [Reticulomyxa filosa]
YKQQFNEFKETNEQLYNEVQELRGRLCELTMGVGIESEFPSMSKITSEYEALSRNYRLNLTREIMKELKSDENIKGKFEITFLARFSHCVSFTILKLSYEFVNWYWNNQLECLRKPFGLSNKQIAQRYFQVIFQEQFKSSFIQLCEEGKNSINLKLEEEISKENTYFRDLLNIIINKTKEKKEDNKLNNKKNELIQSCLRTFFTTLSFTIYF